MPLIGRVAVLFGGPSPEHDVSILTGLQAVHALKQGGIATDVHALYWSKIGAFFEVDHELEAIDYFSGVPQSAKSLSLQLGPDGGFVFRSRRLSSRADRLALDAVLICCHGGPGEDGALQGALDLAGISYSGPTAVGAALGMDKLASGGVAVAAGIPTLPRVALIEGAVPRFAAPYIVKPRYGGSSIGIEVVADYETAVALLRTSVHLRRGAVLEPFRPDLYDLQVAVRTWPALQLSAIERPLRRRADAEILAYGDKYVGGAGMDAAARELPAVIPEQLADQLRAHALVAAQLFGARGVNRIDFLSNGTELYLNEINTVPGSLSKHLFDPPLPFVQLLDDLLAEALQRPAAHFSSAGSDGVVLRDAKNIAAKLS